MRGSVLALRTIYFPNQRTFFPLVSFLSLCWLLQPGFVQPPWPQGLSHKDALGRSRSPSSCKFSALALHSFHFSSSLRASFQSQHGWGCFSWDHMHALAHKPLQALGPATDPPPRTAPGSRQAGLSQPSLLRPGWPPRAQLSRCCLQRQSPLASSR